MRYAPPYTAERFPGDFAAASLCALATAAVLGPLVWWCSRCYLLRAFPHHPELLSAAVVAGLLDAALSAALAFGCCFAVRVWRFERRERNLSDAALRIELEQIHATRQRDEIGGGELPPPPR